MRHPLKLTMTLQAPKPDHTNFKLKHIFTVNTSYWYKSYMYMLQQNNIVNIRCTQQQKSYRDCLLNARVKLLP